MITAIKRLVLSWTKRLRVNDLVIVTKNNGTFFVGKIKKFKSNIVSIERVETLHFDPKDVMVSKLRDIEPYIDDEMRGEDEDG